jgi:hypothetical protein
MVLPIFAIAALDFGGLEVFPSGLLVTSAGVHAVRVSVSMIARTVLIFFIFYSSGGWASAPTDWVAVLSDARRQDGTLRGSREFAVLTC